MPHLRPPSHRWRVRAVLIAAALAACAASDDDAGAAGDTGRAPALPPSMMRVPESNADAVPPAIPYDPATPRLTLRAAASFPHDTAAYTQGLLVHDGRLLEGTGIEGRSEVREVDRATGRVRRRAPLEARQFGEGIAVAGGRLYQLTWKGGHGYVRDAATLAPVDSFRYGGEGWGLTSDGERLYLSDGTSHVRVIDPAGFRVVGTFQAREGGRPVWGLNELEWVRGELWANVYQTDLIARIDPATGKIVGYVDLAGLLTPDEREDVRRRGGVANGIAWDAARERLLVTGKRWPRVFEIDGRGVVAAAPRATGVRRAP